MAIVLVSSPFHGCIFVASGDEYQTLFFQSLPNKAVSECNSWCQTKSGCYVRNLIVNALTHSLTHSTLSLTHSLTYHVHAHCVTSLNSYWCIAFLCCCLYTRNCICFCAKGYTKIHLYVPLYYWFLCSRLSPSPPAITFFTSWKILVCALSINPVIIRTFSCVACLVSG